VIGKVTERGLTPPRSKGAAVMDIDQPLGFNQDYELNVTSLGLELMPLLAFLFKKLKVDQKADQIYAEIQLNKTCFR